jgi:WD40 repeat protein
MALFISQSLFNLMPSISSSPSNSFHSTTSLGLCSILSSRLSLFVTSESRLKLFDPSVGRLIQQSQPVKGDQITCFACHTNADSLLEVYLGTFSGSIFAYEISSETCRWKIANAHSGQIQDLLITDNGTLYSAGADRMVSCWDCTGQSITRALYSDSVQSASSLAISRDQRLLSVATGSSIVLIDLAASNSIRCRLNAHSGIINQLLFSEDSRYLFSSSFSDSFVHCWEMQKNEKKSKKAENKERKPYQTMNLMGKSMLFAVTGSENVS